MKRSISNFGVKCMKRSASKLLFASLVGVVVLVSQTTVLADPVGPSPKITGIIDIAEMKANEAGKVSFQLTNKGPSVKVNYTISKWNGSAWSALKTHSMTLVGKGQDNQSFVVPWTNEEQRVRLEVSAAGHISVAREMKMHAKRVYVLQYKTRGWVQIDYQYQRTTNELIGQGVNAKMAEAKALGFATKRKTDETTYVIGANAYRTYAYAKADHWHERTFNTKAERDTFHHNLVKLVPVLTDNKSDPTRYGPGLDTKLIQR